MLEAMPETSATSKTYDRISLDKWNRIKAKAKTFGLDIPADQGTGLAFGVYVEWKWTPIEFVVNVLNPGYLTFEQALNFLDAIIKGA